MDIDTGPVKLEIDSVCRGCLSSNRALKPLLNNIELFWTILGNPSIPDDCKYSNLLLCWECSAVLQRIAQYQAKIQSSLKIFQDDMIKTQLCISNLITSSKNNFDYIFEYTDTLDEDLTIKYEFVREDSYSETNTSFHEFEAIEGSDCESKEEENDIASDDNVSDDKEETKKSLEIGTRFIEFEFKKERDCEFKEEDYVPSDDNVRKEDETKKILRKPREKRKAKEESDSDEDYIPSDVNVSENTTTKETLRRQRGKKKYMNVTDVTYDRSNVDSHIKSIDFNLKDFVEMKNRNYTKFVVNSLKYYIKRILSMKKRDFVRKADNEKGIKCSFCKEKVRECIRKHWDEHIFTLFKCRYCNTLLHTKGSCISHLKKSHMKNYTCECGFVCNTHNDFRKHYETLHLTFICDLCPRKFKFKERIEKHMRISHLPIKCHLCSKTFKTNHKRKNHIYTHHPETQKSDGTWYCVECDITFLNKYLYQRHFYTAAAHNNKPKPNPVPCPECGKMFGTKYSMMDHYSYYHEKKPRYHCNLCDKYFIRLNKLKQHKKFVHDKVEQPKPNKICHICNKAFAQNRSLIYHIRTHTGERPYKCGYCDAAFAQKYPMVMHEKKQHIDKQVKKCKLTSRKSET